MGSNGNNHSYNNNKSSVGAQLGKINAFTNNLNEFNGNKEKTTFNSTAPNHLGLTMTRREARSVVPAPSYYSSPYIMNNGLDNSYESVSEHMLSVPPDLEEFNNREQNQEKQIKKFNDRMTQEEMTREISARIETKNHLT